METKWLKFLGLCIICFTHLLENGDVVVFLNAAPVDTSDGDDEHGEEEDAPDGEGSEIVSDVQRLTEINGLVHSSSYNTIYAKRYYFENTKEFSLNKIFNK